MACLTQHQAAATISALSRPAEREVITARVTLLQPATSSFRLCQGLNATQTVSSRAAAASRSVVVNAVAYDNLDAVPAEAEGTKLYVGNLPWSADSTALAEMFQEAGVVDMVEVVYDRETGRSRGFGFVTMTSPEDAQAAVDRFNNSELEGRTLRVSFPTSGPRKTRTPNQQRPIGGGRPGRSPESPNKVFVGNLSWGVDDSELESLFADYGNVVDARVVTDRETGRSRGFGFVTLSSAEEVSSAVEQLDGAELDGRQIRVNPASQKP